MRRLSGDARRPDPTSGRPGDRLPWIGSIGAEGSGVQAGIQVVTELRIECANSPQRRPNGASDVDPRSLGLRPGTPVPSTETEGPGELCGDELQLLSGLRFPARVRPRSGLRQVVLELAEACPVVGLRALVENRADVGQDRHGGAAMVAGDQVEHMELAAGGSKKGGEVVQTLAVLHSERVTFEADRPVLALAAQHGGAGGSRRLLVRFRAWSVVGE